MEDTIAELRRQLEEERKAREEAERRAERDREAREEAEHRAERERKAREEAERPSQPNTLWGLLHRCHESLSQAFRVETDEKLLTRGPTTEPVNRLYPKRIARWVDFPQLQEQVWTKFDSADAFTSRPLFYSNFGVECVAKNIQDMPMYSEELLQDFERVTVDRFVRSVIEALQNDALLRHEFGIRGQVTLGGYLSGPSSGNSLDQRDRQDAQPPQRLASARQRVGTTRRRHRGADQFCVHLRADEQQIPVSAVEYKAPHKLTIPELVAGLHPLDLARDIIAQKGETFAFYATRLVAAVITQIFSYMIDSGVRYGYICTGEAFVFLHIPQDDPTVVQYSLCIPNQDVQWDDELRLHRTAIGQVLAFTLQALAADIPSQKWHDKASKLMTWDVDYLDVLRQIPRNLRKDPPVYDYQPLHWKPCLKIHNTRSHARRQPYASLPKHSSTEDGQSTPLYCTIACIRGVVSRDPLDKRCPNWKLHGSLSHPIGPQEFIDQLGHQLARDRDLGFEQLHVCGRTGYLMKSTLLLYGYTVIIKATTKEKQHRLQAEADNYYHLGSLQGQQIPVCLGTFTPRISYWYHGELMEQMMILSWSGRRLQFVINDENSRFFRQERDKALAILQSHGVVHGDIAWRNMLWDDRSSRLIVIDLEDLKWLKRPRALGSKTENARRGRRARGRSGGEARRNG
ncbi:hypothetical protein PDE_07932 [Penicillium oxalicum 114-2]|uniref:Protein kinase domain-containing protein n=1 Tax=Penicillium oxalicum (strain 114-2 / CGMCC 5302) TaxID=933388 RepID=S7ZW32_PENO1|nr:hypothetical protein PDE_07932 [Penicillium oxalicum 114-2]